MKFILGKKQEMTRIFTDDGKAVPVTKIAAGPCFVTAIKTRERDGYQAVQIGFGQKRKLSKALLGHLRGFGNFRFLREFRVEDTAKYDLGDQITVKNFAVGDKVKVTGKNKGKGFQGVVKRHGFHGSPASHGHKDQLRMPGSIGATDAARVFKGMRMGGHMGNAQVTITNLEIVKIDEENNFIYLKGAVPGARGSLLRLEGPGEMELVKAKKAEGEKEVATEKPNGSESENEVEQGGKTDNNESTNKIENKEDKQADDKETKQPDVNSENSEDK